MDEQNQSPGQTQNVQTKKSWYKKWWVILIAVVVVLIVIGSLGSEDETNTNQSAEKADQTQSTQGDNGGAKDEATETAEPEKMEPDMIVTSVEISKDYAENEVAADDKYKGKIIEVTGKVTSIDNGPLDNQIIVELTDGEYDFGGPMCYTKESERDKAIELKKDQQVTLIGKGDSATLGSPVLKECVIK